MVSNCPTRPSLSARWQGELKRKRSRKQNRPWKTRSWAFTGPHSSGSPALLTWAGSRPSYGEWWMSSAHPWKWLGELCLPEGMTLHRQLSRSMPCRRHPWTAELQAKFVQGGVWGVIYVSFAKLPVECTDLCPPKVTSLHDVRHQMTTCFSASIQTFLPKMHSLNLIMREYPINLNWRNPTK